MKIFFQFVTFLLLAIDLKDNGNPPAEFVVNLITAFRVNVSDVVNTDLSPAGELVRIAPIESDTIQKDSILAMGILVKDYERYKKNGVNKYSLQGKYIQLIDSIFDESLNSTTHNNINNK